MAKIGRNQRCPCGSGKKYKRCCGNPLTQRRTTTSVPFPDEIVKVLRHDEARELIRTQQQGLGYPIVSALHADHRFVAVKDTIHFSRNWKFFADFLSDYLKKVMDPEWGNNELKRAFEDSAPFSAPK